MHKAHEIGFVHFLDGTVFISGQEDLGDSMLFVAPLHFIPAQAGTIVLQIIDFLL